MHTRAEWKVLPFRQPARGAAARTASLDNLFFSVIIITGEESLRKSGVGLLGRRGRCRCSSDSDLTQGDIPRCRYLSGSLCEPGTSGFELRALHFGLTGSWNI